ncbi:MAG TPA: outer membrane beta-barrel protein [Steroidobacter sp.]|uniref:outer membrane beta-barrel protein n=1 Tax=Steroidobacter sp. TaxID=1978227 RepID=UPI002EDA7ECA
MDRGIWGYAAASAMFLVSLTGEITEAAEPGFYVGAAGGRSEQRLDKGAGVGPLIIATLPRLDPLPDGSVPIRLFPPILVDPVVIPMQPTEVTADQSDVGWNVALGYRVNKYLAAELSYVNAGEASLAERYSAVADAPISVPDVLSTYTVRSTGPAVSVLGSLPLSEQWQVFLRGGVFFAKQEVETRMIVDSPTAINRRPIERDYSDEVFSIGAGIEWAFLPRWAARLEYQRSDDLQSNDIMGESRLDQATLSVLFGL